MPEPLSIVASVFGIVSSATSIATALGNFIQRTRNAPTEFLDAKSEIEIIGSVLQQLQIFVLGASRSSRQRTSLILVDQVVAILSACVLTFSDLDHFVQTAGVKDNFSVLDRLKWVTSQSATLGGILSRLHQHKISLTLMLTILTWWVPNFNI